MPHIDYHWLQREWQLRGHLLAVELPVLPFGAAIHEAVKLCWPAEILVGIVVILVRLDVMVAKGEGEVATVDQNDLENI